MPQKLCVFVDAAYFPSMAYNEIFNNLLEAAHLISNKFCVNVPWVNLH